MNPQAMVVVIVIILAVGASVWGLFRTGTSWLCMLSGVMVAVGAALGALHAQGESHSIPWTVGYLVVSVIGILSVMRQVIMLVGTVHRKG